jgi:Domain of unknown function (DUF397)
MDNLEQDGWRKSSFSTHAGNCVEFHQYGDGVIGLRNPRNTHHGGAMLCSPDEWRAFIAGVKAGEFDIPQET